MPGWEESLIADDNGIRRILKSTRRIAVLGIKPGSRGDQAAHYVPKYMAARGFEIVPVPVYYPEVTEILGRPVYRRLADVPGPIDMINVFRRSQDVPPHLDDMIAAKPKSVWMQLGISNDRVAEALAKAGIKVVQDRCLMVDHRRLMH